MGKDIDAAFKVIFSSPASYNIQSYLSPAKVHAGALFRQFRSTNLAVLSLSLVLYHPRVGLVHTSSFF